jgi:hypothetical protein
MGKPCFCVSLAEKCEPDLILPFRLLEKIRNLIKPIIIFNCSNTIIYAASVAFIAGYIVKKLNEIFHCDSCLSPICSFSTPGSLLRSINLQNRGGLTYPNYQFASFLKNWQILPPQKFYHIWPKKIVGAAGPI